MAAQLSAGRESGRYWLGAIFIVMGLFVIELALTRAWVGGDA
jgi:hypothetical protein